MSEVMTIMIEKGWEAWGIAWVAYHHDDKARDPVAELKKQL